MREILAFRTVSIRDLEVRPRWRYVPLPVELLAFIPLALIVGFVWGRWSNRVPVRLPEVAQLVMAPLWVGMAGVFVSAILFAPRLFSHGPWRAQLETSSVASLIGYVLTGVLLSLAVGTVLGLPAVLGWAVGYRKRPRG